MSGAPALTIRDIVPQVYRFLLESRQDLVRMAAVPVTALSLISVTIGAFFPVGANPPDTPTSGWYLAITIGAVASLLIYVMFAVAWHRRSLRPGEQVTILTALRWDPRKTRFLLRWIGISLMSFAVVLPVVVILSIAGGGTAGLSTMSGAKTAAVPALIVFVAALATIVIFSLVNTRLALWLPAAAIDDQITLLEAWNLGRDNTWQLFGIVLVSCAPSVLLLLVIDGIARGFAQSSGMADTLTVQFLATLVINFAQYIVIASGVSAISLSYRQLRQPASPGMPYQI